MFIPYERRCFDRAAFVAGLSPLATGPEIASIAEVPTQQSFMQMVSHAVVVMKTEQLDKVVLSRLLEIETCQPVDCHALMARVIVQNPHGFHFHVPLERGALLGASPELLLRQSNGRFYSNPLAGSARRVADAECDLVVGQQLMASEKDRHEHRIVTEGIRQVLASRSHYLNVPQFPELLTTTTLWHLSTPIDGEVASRDESALSLACLLHPTPALCGTPAAAAHALIKQLEPFDLACSAALWVGAMLWATVSGWSLSAVVLSTATKCGCSLELASCLALPPNLNGMKQTPNSAPSCVLLGYIKGSNNMSIIFTPWPAEFASRYRERGYWIDQPLTDILDRQATNDALAMNDARCELPRTEPASRAFSGGVVAPWCATW